MPSFCLTHSIDWMTTIEVFKEPLFQFSSQSFSSVGSSSWSQKYAGYSNPKSVMLRVVKGSLANALWKLDVLVPWNRLL